MNPQPSQARGWIVTFAAFGANLVLGTLYAWGVMGKALVTDWGWTRADASLPFTASTIAFAIMMIFAGRMQDKIGPKLVVFLGGLMLGLGLILSAVAKSPLLMLITFGVVGGIGIGLGYSATTPPSIKWFPPQKKGLISGIVVAGVGLAAVFMAPLTAKLLSATESIPQTFVILGIGAILFVFLMSLIISNPPAGYVPPAASSAPGAKKTPAAPRRDLDWPEMLRTRAFWQLWLTMILAAAAGLMIISQVALIAKSHGIEAGAKFVVVVAIFNTLGRLLSGFVSDKIGRTYTMALFFSLQAVNMFCFHLYTTEGWLLFGAAFAGICYGPVFTLFPSATADFYGIKNLGVNYGLVFTSFGVAGTIGPILSAALADRNNGLYDTAYMVCAVMLIAAVILALITKAPKAAADAPAS